MDNYGAMISWLAVERIGLDSKKRSWNNLESGSLLLRPADNLPTVRLQRQLRNRLRIEGVDIPEFGWYWAGSKTPGDAKVEYCSRLL